MGGKSPQVKISPKKEAGLWNDNSYNYKLIPSLTFENIYLQRHIHSYVHCSIIHGGQNIETAQGSFDT